MNLLVVLSMCVLAANAGIADVQYNVLAAPISSEEERLINAVITADYDTAVAQSQQLVRRSKGRIIEDAVNRLIRGSKRNVLEFAYKLWISNAQDIVKTYFPVQFRQILSESSVKIISERDNLAMKLGTDQDHADDRTAYGDADDKKTENVSWKLIPLWENNRVYFKIYSTRRHQYLKVSTDADHANDYPVYGSNDANTHRHQWYLTAAELDTKILFYIYNRQNNQALKYSRAVDHAGDRQVFSHNGNVDGQPDRFGWSILPLN